MSAGPKATSAGIFVNVLIRFGGKVLFRAPDADPNDTEVPDFSEGMERPFSMFGAVVSNEIRNEVDQNSVFMDPETVADRFSQSLRLEPVHLEVRRRVKGLDVADALVGQIFGNRARDVCEVFILSEEAVLPHPGVDEVGKILVLKSCFELGDVADFFLASVLVHKLPKRGKRYGAF
jgi:hypothetical protein